MNPIMPDIHFYLQGQRRLWGFFVPCTVSAERYLTHRIMATPEDLRSHVQRIFLALSTPANHALDAAVTDLFSVLKGRGKALQQRILSITRPLLAPATISYLQDPASTVGPPGRVLPPFISPDLPVVYLRTQPTVEGSSS